MAALCGRLRDAAADAEFLCRKVERGGRTLASAHRQRDRQPPRLCRRRTKGAGVLCRRLADRRRYPDELCRRNGKSVREAWALPEPQRLAVADARAAGVPALSREGRGVQVREVRSA